MLFANRLPVSPANLRWQRDWQWDLPVAIIAPPARPLARGRLQRSRIRGPLPGLPAVRLDSQVRRPHHVVPMIRVKNPRLFSLAVVAAAAACSSGGNDAGGIKTGGDFVVLQTEPSDNATLFLNDPIRIDFSNPVNLDTVNQSTFSFEVRDQLGLPVAEPVAGTFSLATSPGDTVVGRRLLFVPRLPTNDLFSNGGFRPGRSYSVQLV